MLLHGLYFPVLRGAGSIAITTTPLERSTPLFFFFPSERRACLTAPPGWVLKTLSGSEPSYWVHSTEEQQHFRQPNFPTNPSSRVVSYKRCAGVVSSYAWLQGRHEVDACFVSGLGCDGPGRDQHWRSPRGVTPCCPERPRPNGQCHLHWLQHVCKSRMFLWWGRICTVYRR